MCVEGQDFIVQVAPNGCTPTVVRSDLLEDQDITVFCQLQAIKINPLISVDAIDSLQFKGEYPPEVQTIGFYPSYSALGGNRDLNSLMWNNIGYATIQLRRVSEQNLTNCEDSNFGGDVCYVEGNLSVRIKYDLEGGFGLRTHTFYLPVLSDEEFSNRYGQYAFFDKRGYIRAEDVTSDSATIAVYSGLLQNPYESGSVAKQGMQEFNLDLGESTPKVYLPGLDCLSAVEFQLKEIDYADSTVQLSINSEIVEVKEGEWFLGDRCRISDVEGMKKDGLNQEVEIVCRDDNSKTTRFSLYVQPKVKLKIDGVEGTYSLGDKLYSGKDGVVYLGYLDLAQDGETPIAYVVSIRSDRSKLDSSTLDVMKLLVDDYNSNSGFTSNVLKKIRGGLVNSWEYLANGDKFRKIELGGSTELEGKKVELVGYGGGVNKKLTLESKNFYDLAVNDYDRIIESFTSDKYPTDSKYTLAEQAFVKKIEIAETLNQLNDVGLFCDSFKETFPDSDILSDKCSNMKIANDGVSYKDVLINGDYKRIGFERISEPSLEDYSAEFKIENPTTGVKYFKTLGKNKIEYLDEEGHFVKLISLDGDYARILVQVNKYSFLQGTKTFFSGNKEFVIKIDEPTLFDDYTITLQKVNLERVAKVVVNPSINIQGSEATFPFKIGIEKRAIQLSPEKTESLINTLNDNIEKWTDISSKLGDVVDVMQNSCTYAAAGLTVKNLLFNNDEKSIARSEVMDGWKEYCHKEVAAGREYSVDDCYLEHSSEIDSDVSEMATVIKDQNSRISSIQTVKKSGGFLGEDIVDTDKLLVDYANQVNSRLDEKEIIKNPNNPNEQISISEIKALLVNDEARAQGIYSVDDLKKLDLYSTLYKSNPSQYQEEYYSSLKQMTVNSEYLQNIQKLSDQTKIPSSKITFVETSKEAKELRYEGAVLGDYPNRVKLLESSKNSYDSKTPVAFVSTSAGGSYVFVLDNQFGISNMPILKDSEGNLQVFDFATGQLSKDRNKFENYYFKKYDASQYNNQIKNAEIRYYETEPYKALPAVVPFDVKKGWYVYLPQDLPSYGAIRSYDDSGRVNSFELCNVGSNGIIEATQGYGDDTCQQYLLTSGSYNNFPGLGESETKTLVNNAVNSIYSASRAYDTGVDAVNLNGERVKVGSPYVGASGLDCAEVMSPKECKLLFNLCDPVVCPSSRCDFGGDYPVEDVIQSGIIGSIALCLPNAQEGIYVPVCLTGVKAGIDGLLSVFSAYRDCLNYSLETGETVGICDEIHSIYLCEFLWKQGLPLAKLAIPKLLEFATGEKPARGGGEYLKIQSAWENAQNSVSYFTETYAVNSFKAFKARSQEEVGTEVCKSFVSISYPEGQGFLDVLSETDSPAQFNARFDEIPYTTATNPPTSQYKVYYHIYAGANRGAYFNVYLKGGGSSYYQDTSTPRTIASGYIPTGEYASETKDFVAPSGYGELCVQVNEQTECGFKEVTTSFADDWLKDQYLESETSSTEITTETECLSGSPNVYSFTTLNAQSSVESLINPELYNRGIIRTCATDNPGISTDEDIGTSQQRWKEVGVCGDDKMKCWLDTDSINSATFEFEKTANETLQSLEDTYLNNFLKEKGYLDDEFSSVEKNITSTENLDERIKLIEGYFDKILLNNHKAYLFYLRGNTFGEMLLNYLRENPLALEEEINQVTDYADSTGAQRKTIYGFIESDDFSPLILQAEFSGLGNDLYFNYLKGEWTWVKKSELSGGWKKVVDSNGAGTYEDFVKSLNGRTYPQGILLLVNKIKGNKNHDLITQDVTMDNDGIFSVDSIVLKFNEGRWLWGYTAVKEESRWVDVSVLTHPVLSGASLNEREKLLVTLLQDKGEEEGTLIILAGETYWRKLNQESIDWGQKIYGVAKSYIGQDTTRIEQGEEVYTRVCATFVSNVLIDAGALPEFSECKVDSIPERDAVIELDKLFSSKEGYKQVSPVDWNNNLRVGDILIWGCQPLAKDGGQSYCNSKEYQHITIFSGYDSEGNFKVIHDGGASYNILEKTYSKSANDAKVWYITKVWRYDYVSSSTESTQEVKEETVTQESSGVVRTSTEISKILGSTSVYDDNDRKTFFEAQECTDCGKYGTCGKDECSALSKLLDKNCEYSSINFIQPCREVTKTNFAGTCNTVRECQVLLGNQIKQIASEVNGGVFSKDGFSRNAPAESFECLVLMVGMQESQLSFCKGEPVNGNPLYCEGDKTNVISSGTDWGIMQLNQNYFQEKDRLYFENNVKAGAETLKNYYLEYRNKYGATSQGEYYSCNGETYSDWEYALRKYNGWSTDCSKGNVDYVEEVSKQVEIVSQLFPECEITRDLAEFRLTGWTKESAYETAIYYNNLYPGAKFASGTEPTEFLSSLFEDDFITVQEYNLIQGKDLEFLVAFLKAKLEKN
ncbi:hypothetical protein GW932_04355, partial [archaeon]|nr:hypothetical protein [archaeon]